MDVKEINSIQELEEIEELSNSIRQIIFKHSTRCSISIAAWDRLKRNWNNDLEKRFKVNYLDLLKHRDISNAIEKKYSVKHESPQILVIENGKCVYNDSHSMIRVEFLPL